MSEAKPYPKSVQLARGERRYRRKVASPKQWQAIIAAKRGPCIIEDYLGRCWGGVPPELHHVVPRDFGGDDVADNIVSICRLHHGFVTARAEAHVREFCSKLSDAEYAYAVGKAGEDWAERIYGLRYSRV